MIQLFITLLKRVTKRGYWKLYPVEVINVKLGRSKNQFIQSTLLFIINEQSLSSLPRSAPQPSLIEFKCGRSIK